MNKRSADCTKNSIIAAARLVFAESGYAQASMRQIAQAAHISVGCLYLHFKNKEHLYLALMQGWMKDLEAQTNDSLSAADNPREAIEVFIATSLDFAASHKEMILLQGRELVTPLGRELKKDFFLRRRRMLIEVIEQGVASGVFTPCDAAEAAMVIFNVIRGFVFSLVIDDEALFSAEECCNVLLNGLLRRNSG